MLPCLVLSWEQISHPYYKWGCAVSSCCFCKIPLSAACDCPLCASTWSLFALALPQPAVTRVVMGTDLGQCCDCHCSLCVLWVPGLCAVPGWKHLECGIVSLFPQWNPVQDRLQEGLQCCDVIKPCKIQQHKEVMIQLSKYFISNCSYSLMTRQNSGSFFTLFPPPCNVLLFQSCISCNRAASNCQVFWSLTMIYVHGHKPQKYQFRIHLIAGFYSVQLNDTPLHIAFLLITCNNGILNKVSCGFLVL